ncbi:DUF2147 domain-containing protein [Albimonas sp. CAU 1670]|uniref:DUF2147 domain-containing protein n=1 Tax=Albimonas sp. CAU 1670 TaxID=3032599 RepID=UPI0023DBB5BB|nr:DUF2147 domain-containing protein [Albimonas sp. CAU 1670]MDF2232079.1 DUF2147 domain-containing protein [Albimonas sp. CAU 1670]
MRIRFIAAAALAALAPLPALAGAADGMWRTEANDEGSYLEVEVGACAEDAARTCGVIRRAMTTDGARPDYPHVGRLIIRDMVPEGERAWDDGEIWAPDDDKTYDSSMELVAEGLRVEGCVLVFCRSQVWTPVK